MKKKQETEEVITSPKDALEKDKQSKKMLPTLLTILSIPLGMLSTYLAVKLIAFASILTAIAIFFIGIVHEGIWETQSYRYPKIETIARIVVSSVTAFVAGLYLMLIFFQKCFTFFFLGNMGHNSNGDNRVCHEQS